MPASYDVLGKFLDAYSSAINSGFGLISGDVRATLALLVALSMGLMAIFWVLDETENFMAPLARQVLKIGMFVWIVNDWQGLTQTIIEGFAAIGLKAGGSGVSTSTFLNQPGNIVVLGFKHAINEWNLISQLTGPVDFFINFASIAVLAISAIGVILAFFVIAVQLVVTLIEFRLVTLAAFILVPFGVLNKTSFLAERAFGYVVSSGLKVLTIALVVMIGGKTFDTVALVTMGDKDWMFVQAMSVLLAALLLMMLSLTIPATAAALVTGGPQLGAGGAVAGAAGLAAGAGAAYLAAKGAIAAPAAIAQRAQAAAGATFGKGIDKMGAQLKSMGAAPPAGGASGGGAAGGSAAGGAGSGGSGGGTGGSGGNASGGAGGNLPPSAAARQAGSGEASTSSSPSDSAPAGRGDAEGSSGSAEQAAASAGENVDGAPTTDAAGSPTGDAAPADVPASPAPTASSSDSAGSAPSQAPTSPPASANAGERASEAPASANSGGNAPEAPSPANGGERTSDASAPASASGASEPVPAPSASDGGSAAPTAGAPSQADGGTASPSSDAKAKPDPASSAPPPSETIARARQRAGGRNTTRAAQTAGAASNAQGGAGMTAKFNETEE